VAILANLLKELRLERGVSIAEMAHRLDIPEAKIVRWESGQHVPDLVEVREICLALGASVTRFLGRLERAIEELG